VELIEHVEHVQAERKLPPISYEVGTEEVEGGLTGTEDFRRFLQLLKERLLKHNLRDVWPCFIVGRVGTDLHTTTFDSNIAMKLVEIAATYGSLIKGHYTDYVVNLEAYPATGVGGANVGPEFSDAEYSGLMNLVEMEEKLASEGKVTTLSNLVQVLKNAVVASRRWEKWRRGDELGRSFDEISIKRQSWLIRTGCRYIWTEDRVVGARRKLYQNLLRNGVEAEKLVLEKIVEVMMKYFRGFNLIDSLPKIESELLSRQMQ
jgi:tagatose-1,6-bisphosphate aldolase non-catalytic subunit AgaZ/GatZ